MDDEKQRTIASMGGRAAHAQGRAHEFSQDEAREAGKKGGQAVRAKYGPEFYANIGRIGGGRRGRRNRDEQAAPATDTAQATRSINGEQPSGGTNHAARSARTGRRASDTLALPEAMADEARG